ncbi:hypothetical protein MNR01_11235 [Lysobacter sp. S4-A87]|uniref:hypothetical protein n=1 Tax=Lysobacter sp. S4-A87 TaxID=2925843 RepID=UPI001F538AA0|nr:hypothetical protein [Lysobacter sp. S4-A87]UNK48342.1 hypothetical protein MNR01_11235 [Lysobacter sp. S4-A87]
MPTVKRLALPPLLALSLLAGAPAFAQDPLAQWGIDAGALLGDSRQLLLRAPDASVDGLFQAIHAGAQSPQDANVMCELFDPGAERTIDGYNEVASQLSQTSRVRFANAVADFLVASAQSPPQPYNPALAQQALKAAGVRAAILNDGFLAGLNGSDHPARCRSVGALLDSLQTRPVAERASVMRLLLSQGLDYLALAGAVR